VDLPDWGTVEPVVPEYLSWCQTDVSHEGFVTDGTGMLLCATCGGGCYSDYEKKVK
jgi:hypothetical protein